LLRDGETHVAACAVAVQICTEQEETVMSEPTKKSDTKNEGEGNRTADRKYREDVRRHVESGAPEPAAEEAQEALEGTEADELRKAEDEARTGPKKRS
jgi:hypothetical protein